MKIKRSLADEGTADAYFQIEVGNDIELSFFPKDSVDCDLLAIRDQSDKYSESLWLSREEAITVANEILFYYGGDHYV